MRIIKSILSLFDKKDEKIEDNESGLYKELFFHFIVECMGESTSKINGIKYQADIEINGSKHTLIVKPYIIEGSEYYDIERAKKYISDVVGDVKGYIVGFDYEYMRDNFNIFEENGLYKFSFKFKFGKINDKGIKCGCGKSETGYCDGSHNKK